MSTRAFITGVSGPELSADEREFIRAERPWGFILFKRNIETPAQVARLVQELREAVGDADAPVLIDQEGGRVQRLGPPHWPVYPPGAVFGALYDIDPALGLDGGAVELAADRGRPGRSRDHGRLPAAGGRSGGRRRRRDRQPGLWNRAGQGRGDRARGHRGAGAGRRIAGSQAYSRPWPGHGGHPFPASRRSIRPKQSWNGPISPRFNRWRTCRWR